jgi:hybrid cluster-associated redox disulfide protein
MTMPKRRPSIRAMLRRTIRTIAEGVDVYTVSFSGDMTIDEAWHAHPDAPQVFARYDLPACDGCAVRFDERLKEAAQAYGIDLNLFLRDLNNTLK